MKPILFSFPEDNNLSQSLLRSDKFEPGHFNIHHFPDSETLVSIQTPVHGKNVYLLCSLNKPDEKSIALMFFAQNARYLGALSVTLIAPYLSYMRQDKRFHDGEALTSQIFASFISSYFDRLITIDPHLHRYKSMNDIYTIPVTVLHAAKEISSWIHNNIESPLLIGPDEESSQWVRDIATWANAKYTVFSKQRYNDTYVEISTSEIDKRSISTPVLVDDIISTGNTMIETIKNLKDQKLYAPVCIGIHAIFSGNSFDELKKSGAGQIVTCNTIFHASNEIDMGALILTAIT